MGIVSRGPRSRQGPSRTHTAAGPMEDVTP